MRTSWKSERSQSGSSSTAVSNSLVKTLPLSQTANQAIRIWWLPRGSPSRPSCAWCRQRQHSEEPPGRTEVTLRSLWKWLNRIYNRNPALCWLWKLPGVLLVYLNHATDVWANTLLPWLPLEGCPMQQLQEKESHCPCPPKWKEAFSA